jgi:hypothetical protein
MHDLGYVRSTPRRVTLPKDAVRREANYANNERRQAQRQRRWARSAGRAAVRHGGRKLPPSLNLLEMVMRRRMKMRKRGRQLPLRPEDLSLLGDLFIQQVGISVRACRSKRPWTRTRTSFGPLP